jgi:hypothetical protein
MALPIGATPVLRGKKAAEFLVTIHADAQIPASLTPTPKLAQACKLIEKHAKRQQKRVR